MKVHLSPETGSKKDLDFRFDLDLETKYKVYILLTFFHTGNKI